LFSLFRSFYLFRFFYWFLSLLSSLFSFQKPIFFPKQIKTLFSAKTKLPRKEQNNHPENRRKEKPKKTHTHFVSSFSDQF